MLSQLSNFNSFYKDIQTHAETTRKEFHRLLSISRNDSITAEPTKKFL
jgi:hypothetical protein